jgi:hypothetical protein
MAPRLASQQGKDLPSKSTTPWDAYLAGQPPSASQWSATSQLVYGHRQAQCYSTETKGAFRCPGIC